MSKLEIHKHTGFKLLNLKVANHLILGTNSFNFVDEKDNPESIYFSVLIGPNGTGKSEILKTILTLFRNICRLEKGQGILTVDAWYELTYSNFGNIYTFTNVPKEYRDDKIVWGHIPENTKRPKPYLLENNNLSKYQDFNKASITLPSSIVANSIMLTDKYFVPRNEKEQLEFPMYQYLGVRQRPQQASTRYYVRKTVEFIVDQVSSNGFYEGIKKVTGFFGGERSVNILFYTAYTTKFFNGDLTPRHLEDYFYSIKKQYQTTGKIAPFKVSHYDNMRADQSYMEELCSFINTLKRDERLEHQYASSVKIIRYDVCNSHSHEMLKKEYRYLDDLRKLGILHPPEVTMVEKGEVNLQETSSGEFHFFSTMIGLMASMKSNSLILIDEPEISLHPNWQMKYIEFLRELFSNSEYKTCQIILATHSHFLVSDLSGDSSTIIGLKRLENNITTIDLKGVNTFGWSAEEVLLRIFNVPTTRNYYIADKIGDILELISKKERDEDKIIEKVKHLVNLNVIELSENDPLHSIWKKITQKYG